MSNQKTNWAVYDAVPWAVGDAVYRAVDDAVYWAVPKDSPQPGLRDFLRNFRES